MKQVIVITGASSGFGKAAAEMLAETDMTVFEVAYAVGYSNPSKFSHAFADCMGLNPRAWRQAHLESIREQ